MGGSRGSLALDTVQARQCPSTGHLQGQSPISPNWSNCPKAGPRPCFCPRVPPKTGARLSEMPAVHCHGSINAFLPFPSLPSLRLCPESLHSAWIPSPHSQIPEQIPCRQICSSSSSAQNPPIVLTRWPPTQLFPKKCKRG